MIMEGNDATECAGILSAVILHGHVRRSLRHVAEGLREFVLDPLERLGPVDVFYHSWDAVETAAWRDCEAEARIGLVEMDRLAPGAEGLCEGREEFDGLVDWERLFRNNPMRHWCGDEEEARAMLMDFRGALESQERAWRVFEERKTKSFDLVVATRADLRFLEELQVPERLVDAYPRLGGVGGRECPPSIWVPRFHSWGGVNDRFAVGNEEGARIWSQRVAFAEEWLERAKGETAEWLLMKWLEENRVRVGFMDFTFQRIRANGQVVEIDRGVRPRAKDADVGGGQGVHAPERFLILAREAGERAENLKRVLEPLGRVEVVVDRIPGVVDGRNRDDRDTNGTALSMAAGGYIWISNEEAAGFDGLMSKSGEFPPITAWSRAFAYLERTLGDEESVWFVEDDVAGSAGSFADFVARSAAREADLCAVEIRTKGDDPNWPWWGYGDGYFNEPCRGFQPLCRLSGRLIREVLSFRRKHGSFTFHEVLFSSLAHLHGMSWLDWSRDDEFKGSIAEFRYRPEVEWVVVGISHPVKDAGIHRRICMATPPATYPRMGRAKLAGWSILKDDYMLLVNFCRKHDIRRVAEFGPGDSTLALLDAGCKVVSYENDIGCLRNAVDWIGGVDAVELVHCPEGTVPDAPPFEPDLVFVDGPPFREGQTESKMEPCEWALEACGCFLLHDAKRPGETATLEAMERRGLGVIRFPTRKGLALVVDPNRKPGMLPLAVTGAGALSDSLGTKPQEDNWFVLSVFFHESSRGSKILHVGAGGGEGVVLWLDEMFPHPASEVHCIDCYDGDEGGRMRERFDASIKASGYGHRVHLYEGTSREVLAWMIAGDSYWESFDFVYLWHAVDSSELLADACQAWNLLKPGGIVVMPGLGPEGTAAEAFLEIYCERAEKLVANRWIAARKIR
jgi:predicted O-methyltransferase YrrM